MGQYFYFINTTTNDESTVPIPINFGVEWAKNMHNYSESLKKYIFLYIIVANYWKYSDLIEAQGDDGDLYKWSDYSIDLSEKDKSLTSKELWKILLEK